MIVCPVCFENSLVLNNNGVIQVFVNDRSMNNNRVLFRLPKDNSKVLIKNIMPKIEDYYKWYGTFTNKEPIKKIDLVTTDYTCSNKCRIPGAHLVDIKGSLIDARMFKLTLMELTKKYGFNLRLEN
jgi:hypothetical protein